MPLLGAMFLQKGGFSLELIVLCCIGIFVTAEGAWSGDLRFRTNGTFKVVVFTDLHMGEADEKDNKTITVMDNVLSAEEDVDLVVLSGDMLSGWLGKGKNGWVESLWPRVLTAVERHKLPYAYINGNHDAEGNLNSRQVVELDAAHPLSLTQPGSPYLPGASNYYLTICASQAPTTSSSSRDGPMAAGDVPGEQPRSSSREGSETAAAPQQQQEHGHERDRGAVGGVESILKEDQEGVEGQRGGDAVISGRGRGWFEATASKMVWGLWLLLGVRSPADANPGRPARAWQMHQSPDAEATQSTTTTTRSSSSASPDPDLSSKSDSSCKEAARIWMIDTLTEHQCGLLGHDCCEHRVPDWLKKEAAAMSGGLVPGLAFSHIPTVEHMVTYDNRKTWGYKAEKVSCYPQSSCLVKGLKAAGVSALYCGHDHNNNFYGTLDGIRLGYGHKTGYGSYGPPAGWQKGARVLLLREGQDPGESETWIRNEDGSKEVQKASPEHVARALFDRVWPRQVVCNWL